ncbi:hypothetical protein JAAARDRAFT_206326 [Jaapia argillacea MUCL 33604]|uniref:Uncharacterized protein n=1 Tax=Jaapia argillacea MUCL 33604 TaxID=933084 RepID=A0A067PUG7_9AGAM|nr:hypothetical protein JAAARDRAFT_206326 [Jaapia argillacea MUCL 33604]
MVLSRLISRILDSPPFWLFNYQDNPRSPPSVQEEVNSLSSTTRSPNIAALPGCNSMVLPPELLHDVVAEVVAEYIDRTIAEPNGVSNDLLALLQVSHQIREATLKVVCDAFTFERNPNGSLPSNPFNLIAAMRKNYQDSDAHNEKNGSMLCESCSRAKSASDDVTLLDQYQLLVMGQCYWQFMMGLPEWEDQRLLKLGYEIVAMALFVPPGRLILHSRVTARARNILAFWVLVAYLRLNCLELNRLTVEFSNCDTEDELDPGNVKRAEEVLKTLEKSEARCSQQLERVAISSWQVKITKKILEVFCLADQTGLRASSHHSELADVGTALIYVEARCRLPALERVCDGAMQLTDLWGQMLWEDEDSAPFRWVPRRGLVLSSQVHVLGAGDV